jgi:sigma-B regulation protein RsbU (phosphoserine phosphatase)
MDPDQLNQFHNKLLDRKKKLAVSARDYSSVSEIKKLISDIDDAIIRIKNGTYGFCEVCNDPIEMDRLEADPLLSFCLDHLTTKQQRNLENDLKLAAKIQRNLLPAKNLDVQGWDIAFHYEPAGLVSGDYCDIILTGNENDSFYVVLGDVTGKGVSAAMLMTHLHAMFHTLIPLNLQSNDLIERMNRVLCESILTDQYATLLLAIVNKDGEIIISNAGHCLPIIFNNITTMQLDSNGIPLGIMCGAKYDCNAVKMNAGDILFLYSDGLIEAMKEGEMFGISRLLNPDNFIRKMTSRQIIDHTLAELNSFLNGSEKIDDLTIIVLKKL